MKVRVNREQLLKRLSDIQFIVDKKGSMEVLNHFLLNAKSGGSFIIATDLETAIKVPIEIDEVIEEGQYCLHGKRLLEIAKELSGDIHIEKTDEGWVTVTSGKTVFRLTGLSAENFPGWPSIEVKTRVSIPKRDLLEMINKTFYAVAESDPKHTINCALLDIKEDGTVNMVGTDGHRLAVLTKVIDFYPPEGLKLIISRRSIAEIKRVLDGEGDIELCIEKNYIMLKTEDKELLCRLVEGNYPNYEAVIPLSNQKTVIVQKEELSRALRKACILGKEKTNTVFFDIEQSNMTVTAFNPEVGEVRDEVSVTFNDEPMRIAFSARLLLESINVIDSENIVIKMHEPLTAVLIMSALSDDYKGVLMPMRQ
jgi:DNA polymerase-3 subunit beta